MSTENLTNNIKIPESVNKLLGMFDDVRRNTEEIREGLGKVKTISRVEQLNMDRDAARQRREHGVGGMGPSL